MTRAHGPAYPDGSSVVGYFTIGGTRMERVAPAELRAECAAVPTFAQVCVGPDASGGEFMCAECLAAAI